MKKIIILLLLSSFLIVSCSKVRQSAGVNRKNIDEFSVIESPPLVIPPDLNLLPPDQLEEKDLDKAESDLAKEILFGLEEATNNNSELSTMENILSKSNADETDGSIRDEIDEKFASEKRSVSKSWDDEIEILDSITESERIRKKLLNNQTESNEEVPTVKVKNPNKKKKRFFFF
ncbi:DUF3035 domain-containing protein [Pelagibacteraceae bacterium]|nr:DUF3035 domain-containing protein [Pelagibacteraceae bacterium]